MDEELQWYALRAFKRKIFKIKEDFEAAGWKTYIAMRSQETTVNGHLQYKDVQIVPNLLFVCCPESSLKKYKDFHDGDFMIYKHKVKKANGDIEVRPAPIPEKEMKVFIFITSTGGGKDIEYYGDTMPDFSEGQRVRVIDGIYKGAEGVVKRIKRDRKLLVAVEGVAIVAISNIPMSYLEKI
ncbi:MAG: UpxY family transcription antiterminator [Bacteroidales bacterium]|nr:UpxY family transcription antiterminator [Bacteroidales bacterium]